MKLKKRAQGEIIGLLVIIILVIVLLAIFLRLAPVKKSESASIANRQAKAFTLALLDMSVCKGVSLQDAVKACQEFVNVCGQDSCALVEDTVDEVVNAIYGQKLNTVYISLKDRSGKINLVKSNFNNLNELKFDCLNKNKQFGIANSTISFGLGTIVIGQCIS